MGVKRLKCLIIDDDRFMRAALRFMLSEYGEMEIAGEAGSVGEASSLLGSVQPDVVFLDIQLHGGSGFDLVPCIPPRAHIVFFTAYARYAVRAFEVNALDYLLKPVQADRLAATVERLRHNAPKIRNPTRTINPTIRFLSKPTRYSVSSRWPKLPR